MTSVDLSAFYAESGKPGTRCTVGIIFGKLDADHAAQLRHALATPDIQSSAIARVVKTWGHDLTSSTIGRHRRAECHCEH